MRKQKRLDKKIKKMPVPKTMRPDHRATAPAQNNKKVQQPNHINGKKGSDDSKSVN
jgi:hypothetical protein